MCHISPKCLWQQQTEVVVWGGIYWQSVVNAHFDVPIFSKTQERFFWLHCRCLGWPPRGQCISFIFWLSFPSLRLAWSSNNRQIRIIRFQKLFTSATTSVQVRSAGNFRTELPEALLILNNNVEIDVRLVSFDYSPKSKALKIIFSIVITVSHHWPPILPCFVVSHFAKIASNFFSIFKNSQICNHRSDFKSENAVMALEIGSLVWTLEVKCILGRIELKVGWRDRVISGLYRALRDSQGMRAAGSAGLCEWHWVNKLFLNCLCLLFSEWNHWLEGFWNKRKIE